MTHYTVFSPDNGYVVERGITALEAMRAILEHDGYAYKFTRRKSDGRLSLWHSDGSANSTRGARHFKRTVALSFSPGLKGQKEIAMQVISAHWPGLPEAMTDAEYDKMVLEPVDA